MQRDRGHLVEGSGVSNTERRPVGFATLSEALAAIEAAELAKIAPAATRDPPRPPRAQPAK